MSGSRALCEAAREAVLQIEYLHEKFGATGSGAAVLARLREALAAVEPAPVAWESTGQLAFAAERGAMRMLVEFHPSHTGYRPWRFMVSESDAEPFARGWHKTEDEAKAAAEKAAGVRS